MKIFYIFLPNFQTRYVQFLVKLLIGSTKYNYVYEDFELYIFEQKMLRQEFRYFKTENLKFKENLDQFLKLHEAKKTKHKVHLRN